MNINSDSSAITLNEFGWDTPTIVDNLPSTIGKLIVQRNALSLSLTHSDVMESPRPDVNKEINDDDPLTIEEISDLRESAEDLRAGNFFVISEAKKGSDIVRKIIEFGENE